MKKNIICCILLFLQILIFAQVNIKIDGAWQKVYEFTSLRNDQSITVFTQVETIWGFGIFTDIYDSYSTHGIYAIQNNILTLQYLGGKIVKGEIVWLIDDIEFQIYDMQAPIPRLYTFKKVIFTR